MIRPEPGAWTYVAGQGSYVTLAVQGTMWTVNLWWLLPFWNTHPDPAIKPTGRQLGNLTWNALFPRKTFGNVVARCLAKHQAQMLGRRTSLSTFLGSGGNALQTFGYRLLRTGNVPDRWREAAVVLLPKDDGGVRP